MSATVTYKGSTLTTVNNETKKLDTAGTWLEDDITITDVSEAGTGGVIQDENGYLVLDEEGGSSTPTVSGYTFDEIGPGNYSNTDTVNIPTATFIKPYTFCGATSIVTVNAPEVTTFKPRSSETSGYVGQYTFAYCSSLKNINMPKLAGYGSGGYQFAYCTSLEHVFFPSMSGTGQYMFTGCTKLVDAVMAGGNSVQLNGYAFSGCTSLERLDFKNITRVYTQEFNGSTKFNVLVIRNASSTPTLSNINAFGNTPFASGKAGGTLYVPSSRISAYQAASNWSTILGYANNTITAIEGSIYETQYVDGTPFPQTITNTLTNCTSSNTDTTVLAGDPFETTITANNGYTLSSVAVTMKRVDVTSTVYNSSTGVISIAEVDGPIVITATAE